MIDELTIDATLRRGEIDDVEDARQQGGERNPLVRGLAAGRSMGLGAPYQE